MGEFLRDRIYCPKVFGHQTGRKEEMGFGDIFWIRIKTYERKDKESCISKINVIKVFTAMNGQLRILDNIYLFSKEYCL